MKNEQEIESKEKALESLQRMQTFDTSSLKREELGIEMNFEDAVEPANRIILLYKQISINVLEDFPVQQLNSLVNQANADYNRFQEIINFSQKENDAFNRRNNIIEQIQNSYQSTFNSLSPLISYSTNKSVDFKRLEIEARAIIQNIIDEGHNLAKQLEAKKLAAESALAEIRAVAAEQGVSQQALYFKTEAENHDKEAHNWKVTTNWLAIGMGAYAVFTLFLHKIPWFQATNVYDSVQLAVSKVLIFAVISYMLYLSAKNFLAHRHNSIVNKHRQNALMTYKAIVEASSNTENKEVILAHASSCIFGPQATGYSQEKGSSSPSAKSVIELMTKPFNADS